MVLMLVLSPLLFKIYKLNYLVYNANLARFPFEMEIEEEEVPVAIEDGGEESFVHLLKPFPSTQLNEKEGFASSTPKLTSKMSRRVIGERFSPIVGHDSTEVEKLKKEVEDLKRAYDDVLREKPCVKNCGTEVCLLENLKVLLTDKVIVMRSDWERLKERSSRLTGMEHSLKGTEKLAKRLKSEVDGLDSSFKM